MYMTILRMLWPYLGRHVANYAASYLQERHEQRLQALKERAAVPECPPCPPCPPLPAEMDVSTKSHNTIWFTLSGLLLGGAFSLIAYIFIQDKQA